VGSLAFSPDGLLLTGSVSQGGAGSAVKFWELATGEQRSITLPDLEAAITGLTFSPDSRYLALQTEETEVWVLSLETQADPVILRPGVKSIRSVTFSGDSDLIALATGDGIQLWERASGSRLASVSTSSVSAAFNHDSTLLATGESDGGIKLWGDR
jgi:WD40 repeat protein